ncbi:Phosphoserine phosphatase(Phosphoserine phosphatase SerB,78-287) [Magnetospirillum sp. XM-1]|uniref:phosphoserine phosphatase SerB n=1 Tax=Magnetospirillum sp. XM-1 TaxID=1663591 RepID=UPI00073E09B2|nr:phosphoserine phosphatase SerB [Magnetospirillum sp. XM-1]CUW38723.1 Phosphoserine phosphatase(Phosphoserine phosphatase SerB,78-287) [Magnetospirillum sp. XM-1]
MINVLTLIAGHGGEGLDSSLVFEVRGALRALGAEVGHARWLSPEHACDLDFSELDPREADQIATRILEGWNIDVVAQKAEGRRKKLLVADMDSTMVTGETLDELADFAGLKDHIARITARAMNGEIGFEAALRERVGLLKDLPEECLQKTWDLIKFTPGAHKLVRTMTKHGAYAVLVSGGFKFFTAKVRESCGFHRDIANELIVENGKLTGQVGDTIIGREAKLATLNAVSAELGITPELAVAVGDGANDLDMLRAAGLGVAFHAKPVVAAEARVRVDHGDLVNLLYAQGYTDDEMVE